MHASLLFSSAKNGNAVSKPYKTSRRSGHQERADEGFFARLRGTDRTSLRDMIGYKVYFVILSFVYTPRL